MPSYRMRGQFDLTSHVYDTILFVSIHCVHCHCLNSAVIGPLLLSCDIFALLFISDCNKLGNHNVFLNIYLTVHLRVIPVGNQFDAQFFL
jgi:hypothetical protein